MIARPNGTRETRLLDRKEASRVASRTDSQPRSPRFGAAAAIAAIDAFAPNAFRASDLIGAAPPPPFSHGSGSRD
jgi:hypothetical protein